MVVQVHIRTLKSALAQELIEDRVGVMCYFLVLVKIQSMLKTSSGTVRKTRKQDITIIKSGRYKCMDNSFSIT